MRGVRCYKPQATFVIYVDISELDMSAERFTQIARDTYKVAVVPGGATFFGPGSEGHIRICLATSREVLEEGLNRLERALQDTVKNKTI